MPRGKYERKPRGKYVRRKKASVTSIIAAKAAHDGTSAGERLRVILDERKIKPADFIRMLGKTNDPIVYGVLREPHMGNIGPKTAASWEKALGLPEGTFPFSTGRGIAKANAPTTVAWAPPKAVAERPPPDQFSLTVDHAGRASLRLNLTDLPMEVAMRAVAALAGIGLRPFDKTDETVAEVPRS